MIDTWERKCGHERLEIIAYLCNGDEGPVDTGGQMTGAVGRCIKARKTANQSNGHFALPENIKSYGTVEPDQLRKKILVH